MFRAIQQKKLLTGSSHHALSVGPYCANDYRFVGLFPNQIWRWGYFPAVLWVETDRTANRIPQILWAGRMLKFKRVDLLLSAVAWVRAHGEKPFRLKIVGLGPEEEKLRTLSNNLELTDICEFQGPQTPEKIALLMDQSDIYVLPSDRNEGWGVVVNEAMSHGCCVIGSKDAGSVPYLIQDKVNGRIFDGANVENLGRILGWCIDNPERRLKIGMAAKKTITELWSPTVAAKRFLTLCEQIGEQRPSIFTDNGPCSPA